MALSYKVNVTTGTQVAAGNAEFSAARVEEYLYNQTGLLSSIGGGQALAFEKFPESYRQEFSQSTRDFLDTFPRDWPEVNYLSLEYGSYPSDLGPNDNYLTIGSALLTTSARGNLTIQSADIADPPVISPNWLLDEGDQEQAIAALQRIREIAFNSTIVEEE
jgi:choline dehydrogenase